MSDEFCGEMKRTFKNGVLPRFLVGDDFQGDFSKILVESFVKSFYTHQNPNGSGVFT